MTVGAMLGRGVRDIQNPWGMTQIAVSQSPGVAMAAMGGLTDRCFVAGEPVFITVQHQVVPPMRFNQVVAQRFASSLFGCAFEVIGPNSRLCIAILGWFSSRIIRTQSVSAFRANSAGAENAQW